LWHTRRHRSRLLWKQRRARGRTTGLELWHRLLLLLLLLLLHGRARWLWCHLPDRQLWWSVGTSWLKGRDRVRYVRVRECNRLWDRHAWLLLVMRRCAL
jgi:hypothetical protein